MEPSPTLLTGETPKATGAQHPLTVGEVVSRIRALIERQFPQAVWVEGELSNCSYPASGHIYFSLVDEQATDRFGQRLVLPCAFFRGANQHLRFKLVDGLKVVCLGEVTTFESRGQYQLKVLRLEPKGIGALQLAFEQLKQRLAAEGLFRPERKRPIPRWPSRVGIITSRSGSAVHDMVSKLRDCVQVIVLPVKVQGDGAAAEIAAALDLANRLRLADVLIVGRGGGSVEDLWAFNEEALARAIVRSSIPVISAVGHQDDWTIADYVADLRASTPTDAAKLLVQAQQALREELWDLARRLVDLMRGIVEEETHRLEAVRDRLRLLHPQHQLERLTRHARELLSQLIQSARHRLRHEEQVVQGLAGRLQALSPLAVLARGYSITFRLPERRIVMDAAAVAAGEELETVVSRGRITSTVQRVEAEILSQSDLPDDEETRDDG